MTDEDPSRDRIAELIQRINQMDEALRQQAWRIYHLEQRLGGSPPRPAPLAAPPQPRPAPPPSAAPPRTLRSRPGQAGGPGGAGGEQTIDQQERRRAVLLIGRLDLACRHHEASLLGRARAERRLVARNERSVHRERARRRARRSGVDRFDRPPLRPQRGCRRRPLDRPCRGGARDAAARGEAVDPEAGGRHRRVRACRGPVRGRPLRLVAVAPAEALR